MWTSKDAETIEWDGILLSKTRTPTEDLHLVNKKYVDDNEHWEASGNDIYNSNSGNVGIGTTSPDCILDIKTDANDDVRINTIDANSNAGYRMENDVQAWRVQVAGGDSDKFRINDKTNSKVPFWIYPDCDSNTLVLKDGKVGIGTTSPATSAKVDITSTTGALLVPIMTTAQRNALTAVNRMIIYNATTNAFNFYENGSWVTGSGLT